MSEFDGQVVLVTGASSGIGLATTKLLTDRGATVAAVALDDPRLTAAQDEVEARFFSADVSDSASVARVFAEVEETVGPIAGVFNAAGISSVHSAVETTDEQWQRLIAVNLTGSFNVARAALRSMSPRGRGSIVLTASELSLQGVAGYAAYTATKGGVLAMVRPLAAEGARLGIRVNSVAPGTTDTPMLAAEYASQEDREGDEAMVPLGRFAAPSEIAEVAAWLLSSRSSYVTATNVLADGGRTGTYFPPQS